MIPALSFRPRRSRFERSEFEAGTPCFLAAGESLLSAPCRAAAVSLLFMPSRRPPSSSRTRSAPSCTLSLVLRCRWCPDRLSRGPGSRSSRSPSLDQYFCAAAVAAATELRNSNPDFMAFFLSLCVRSRDEDRDRELEYERSCRRWWWWLLRDLWCEEEVL